LPIQLSLEVKLSNLPRTATSVPGFEDPFSPPLDELWNYPIHFLKSFWSVLKVQQKSWRSNPWLEVHQQASSQEVQSAGSRYILAFSRVELSNGWGFGAARRLGGN